MKTNKFFSPRRFGLLLQNDLLLNYKMYLLTLAGGAVVTFLFIYYRLYRASDFRGHNYDEYFAFFMLGVGALVGLSFVDLSDKRKIGSYLMLPGSTFEKYMVQFFVRVIVLVPLALLIFWVDARLARFSVLHTDPVFPTKILIEPFDYSHIWQSFGDNTSERLALILIFFSLGSWLFSVRILFRRFSLAKTILSGVAVGYLLACVFVLFSHLFYPETKGFDVLLPIYFVFPDIVNMQLYTYLIGWFSWLFLLPFGYFKLKEKEQ